MKIGIFSIINSICKKQKNQPPLNSNCWIQKDHECGDCEFDPQSSQTKDYEVDLCCFSTKHASFRKTKDLLARNQDNVCWNPIMCLSQVRIWLSIDKCCGEWVSNCCLTLAQQFFSYIMERKSKFSMRLWWGPLCTRPTRIVGFF
jgi:hypothetical protein